MTEIHTERLTLRHWRESDLDPWAAVNADPEVMRFLGPPLTPQRSTAAARRWQEVLDRRGYGFWAVEVRDTGEFVGVTGLDRMDEGMPFSGVEVGWRLARPAWGHGYATEAARAALAYGFDTVGLPEILAVVTAPNARSHALARRLGMTTDPAEDFDHPRVTDERLRRHVIHRLRAEAYRSRSVARSAVRGDGQHGSVRPC
ncbi:GNAT family N-acetyltransferase [Micromonospora endolithica]|uniref:N-acetyltransferase n=1 Tax=Micromonospora endolithica TaxID=230091 RepID=A0A3A9YV89_9ACTN|nr:GNAT family N-acetyltransferase [Micromonospora endolithica]RKN39669.1 N-acetyltransferase [Micromonospora endolithica]TWJ22184.1 RimJ/RimL family protein N-acetyltransferase [Micromonospora endolithica]